MVRKHIGHVTSLVLTLLASLPALLVGQEGVSMRAPLRFEQIAQEQGLSHGTVTAIAQDSIGFLWLGTEHGLNRYDGAGFTTFRPIPGDNGSLGSAWITGIAMGLDGSVWASTVRAGLSRFDPRTGRFRVYAHRPGDPTSLASNTARTIHITRDGMVWIGSPEGLDMLDPSTGEITHHVPELADTAAATRDVKAIIEDDAGLLWVGTLDRLLVFDRRTGRFHHPGVETYRSSVHAMARDSSGAIWVGSEHQLVSIDPVARRIRRSFDVDTVGSPSPFSGRVLALFASPDGAIWVGSDDGLARLDPVSGTFVRHRSDRSDPRSLGGSIVRSILVDRGGVLWAGLESYGVSKHAPSTVRFDLLKDDPHSRRSLSSGYVRGISEDRRGNLWIGTQFGGLNHLDRRTGRVTVYRHRPGDPTSVPGDNVWGALEDHAGVVWVATHREGFGTLDPATGVFVRHPAVDRHTSITVLYEDRSGALLLGTEGSGMLEISPDRTRIVQYGATSGDRRVLAGDDIQAILETADGALWVGATDGLTMLDRGTGRTRIFHAAPGDPTQLQNEFVTDIYEDRHGGIWVSTKGGGVSRLDRESGHFTTIGTEAGLPHSFVYGILEDDRGKLWLSTDNGIASLDQATGRIARYGLEDGLQAREFNRRAFHRTPDGTMYFGGINGINIFRPDEAAAVPPPPPVVIASLRAGQEAPLLLPGRGADSALYLPHDRNALAISFRALDYTAPDKVTYRYMLEGIDRDWIEAGSRREASYASLPPGHYTFRVTAAGQDGAWNPVGTSVQVRIAPPWWDTWWARAAMLASIALLVMLVVRLRLASARRRSRTLEQRVEKQTRELTHAQDRLRIALDREREAARELLDITAAVPGAVFQMRMNEDGERDFTFVSDGILELARGISPLPHPEGVGEQAGHGQMAERLFLLASEEERATVCGSLQRSRDTLLPWRAEWRWQGEGERAAGWLQLQAQPRREPDGTITWTGVLSDATAARKAEAARAALEAKVLQAQQAESLAVLAGGIAHDFNNLLVGVQGNAELLAMELPAGSEEAETVRHIRSAATRAADLTRQLLAYAGRGRFVVEEVNLSLLVREMLALVRSAVPRTISFDFQHDEAHQPIVEADATQLRQVVMNLVTNASEAIGGDGGRVSVSVGSERRGRAALRLLHAAPDMPLDGPYAVLRVTDDGNGMDRSALSRIFDPFYTTKFTGRGLGLAALLGVVRAHHGGLNVITAPGEGASFVIYLPLAGVAQPEHAPQDVGSRGGTGRAADTRVLLVDDEPDVSDLTARMLRRIGYEVAVASDGASALDALRSRDGVDVVLMDVTMPNMDGPSAARTLRARGVAARIVLMSGYAETELVERGVLADADAFLQKPFSQAELAAAVEGRAAGPRPEWGSATSTAQRRRSPVAAEP